jgi:hypothetical protein
LRGKKHQHRYQALLNLKNFTIMKAIQELRKELTGAYENCDCQDGCYYYIYSRWYYEKQLFPAEKDQALFSCSIKKGLICNFVKCD